MPPFPSATRRLHLLGCTRYFVPTARLAHSLTTDVGSQVANIPWQPPEKPSSTSLYVWGCNLGGMLGREHTTPRISMPDYFPLHPENLRRQYQSVTCGVDFTLIGTPRGKAYVYMGSNAYMSQALHLDAAVWANEDVKDDSLPVYDPNAAEEYFHTGCGAYQLHCQFWRRTGIKKAAAGRAHALFLSEHGDIYYAGRHDGLAYPLPKDLLQTREGQLDSRLLAPYTVGADDTALRESRSVTAYAVTQHLQRDMAAWDVDFRDIACGFEHSLAIDYYGFLYSWGLNTDGQCGRSTDAINCEFGYVEGPVAKVAIISVSTCADSCVAVDKLGRLWTWGNNEYHQLMLGTDDPQVRVPTQVDRQYLAAAIGDNNQVLKVAMGGSFGALVDIDGKLWTWGWGAALGQGRDTRLSRWPRHVPLPGRVSHLEAGVNNMAVITEDGTMYAWGAALHDSVPVEMTDEERGLLTAGREQKATAPAATAAVGQTYSVWAPRAIDLHYPVIDCGVGPHHMVALVEEMEI